MRKLDKTEASNKSTTIMGDIVTVVHTVKPNEESQSRYELTWKYDYTNVTREELMRLATRPMVITKQGQWRGAKDRMNTEKWDNVTFVIRDLLDGAKKKADPVEKAKKALDALPEDVRAALIAEMVAEQSDEEQEENN